MQNEVDSDIAVDITSEVLKKYSNIVSCSYDKGFWSPENKKRLDSILETAALMKKGKVSKADKEEQYSKKFMKAKKGHSAVESNINALQVHGLNKCPDKGLDSYKSYVSLSVLSRNIQHLGSLIMKKAKEKQKRSEAIKQGLKLSLAA